MTASSRQQRGRLSSEHLVHFSGEVGTGEQSEGLSAPLLLNVFCLGTVVTDTISAALLCKLECGGSSCAA